MVFTQAGLSCDVNPVTLMHVSSKATRTANVPIPCSSEYSVTRAIFEAGGL